MVIGAKDEVTRLDLELEGHVWALAQKVFGDPGFTSVIDKLVGEYKRRPGIDSSGRLHASDIGEHCVAVLSDSLKRHGITTDSSDSPSSYVAVRSRLRNHLHHQLQWQLMKVEGASEAIQEEFFARDLSL